MSPARLATLGSGASLDITVTFIRITHCVYACRYCTPSRSTFTLVAAAVDAADHHLKIYIYITRTALATAHGSHVAREARLGAPLEQHRARSHRLKERLGTRELRRRASLGRIAGVRGKGRGVLSATDDYVLPRDRLTKRGRHPRELVSEAERTRRGGCSRGRS